MKGKGVEVKGKTRAREKKPDSGGHYPGKSLFLATLEEFYTARRLFRFGKSVQHIHKLRVLWENLKCPGKRLTYFSLLLSHLSYATYVAVDHVAILCKMKVLNFDEEYLEYLAFWIWFVGLITSLTFNVVKLRLSFKREAELKTMVVNHMTPKEIFELLDQFSETRKTYCLNAVRNIGDILVALDKMKVPQMVLGTNLNKLVVSFGGLTATVISIYHMYQKDLYPQQEETEEVAKQGKKKIFMEM